jgi:hypothetical protein
VEGGGGGGGVGALALRAGVAEWRGAPGLGAARGPFLDTGPCAHARPPPPPPPKRRVEANADWSLFCPNEAPGLADVWGPAFDALYARYEAEGRARRVVRAQQLWFAILEAQIETGNPFMLYKV